MLGRRSFLGAGLAGASALTFSSVWSQAAPNFGPPGLPATGFRRMKRGAMEGIACSGGVDRLNPGRRKTPFNAFTAPDQARSPKRNHHHRRQFRKGQKGDRRVIPPQPFAGKFLRCNQMVDGSHQSMGPRMKRSCIQHLGNLSEQKRFS